jgi:hypothetical protein
MRLIPGPLVAAALQAPRFLGGGVSFWAEQKKTLSFLLKKAAKTRFGEACQFRSMMSSPDVIEQFVKNVPLHTYEEMFDKWWFRCVNDEEDVTWPGRVPYFGRSSGTAGVSSKHIPVTIDMIRSTNKVGLKQTRYLSDFEIPFSTYRKQVLMLGSTTSLKKVNAHFEGDLSGICALHMPAWIRALYYKPGARIISIPEWNERLEKIVQEAWKWDIGTVCGVPSWVQILLQKIVTHYKLRNIHELWPNFSLYIHGGVAITNYREPLQRLFGKQVACMETYMASEGSFGFQAGPARGIRLVGDAGIFYEFIPFNGDNFDSEGNLKPGAAPAVSSEIKGNISYAVVLSTCAGAWRYLIGDVVRFTNVALAEVSVVGRTKQYLDHCGEHVSVDNLTKAVDEVARSLGINISEFGVSAERCEDLYAHHWYLGCDDASVDIETLSCELDTVLCRLNDDYRVERKSAIREVRVSVFPNRVFTDYLKWRGREGDMSKFPRVLKETTQSLWKRYLTEREFIPVVSSTTGED